MSTVTCSTCGTESAAGKKFCAECGAPLPLTCPSCGNAIVVRQKFCDECGAPLQSATSPGQTVVDVPRADGSASQIGSAGDRSLAPERVRAEEERRLVTALFCDLVGFTPLSEQLDPEEIRDIQADYFSAMSQQIERYGGTVEKYAGDAVLALFGAPLAHEDDAERAVLCALGMQIAIEPVADMARTRWHVEPQIRVGVNSGEVVSGTWSASGRQDVAVTGDALNTAARMQAAAGPGEVLVGSETMRLTRRRIRYGERRDVALKGKVGTVAVWPALGVREEIGERWEGHETPLVGRERELTHLLDAWNRVEFGEGQLITIVGDAGVGKSRLIAEFVASLGYGARIIRARSLSYGQNISLWLVADLLRSLFGLGEQHTTEAIRSRLTTSIKGLLADASSDVQDDALDVIGEVLGVPMTGSGVAHAGPQARRQALIRSARALLTATAARVPTVLVLEDVHWIDPASEEVLREIATDIPGSRLLVLAAQRPGWAAPWSDWSWPERLALRQLDDADSMALAGAVLGGRVLSPELQQYVSERAGGNPFFLEEMLRALEEGGDLEDGEAGVHLAPGAAERLPSTLVEVLLARLDRLEGQARGIAQVGSVIGRAFSVRLLAEVLGQEPLVLETPLLALQQAEIAFSRRSPELEYVFKHASMRDVAYNTLVHRRRQELHLRTARAMAALYPVNEYIDVIAYHYGKTEQYGEAIPWLERAGDRAAAIYANETAVHSYRDTRRRMELAGGEELDLARVDEKLGNIFFTMVRYDEAIEALERAADAYERANDLQAAGRAVARLARCMDRRGTTHLGRDPVQRAIERLTPQGPSESLALLHLSLAFHYHTVGRPEEMLAATERAAEIARAVSNDHLAAVAEERRGVALQFLGQVEESKLVLETTIHHLEAVGDLETMQLALGNLGQAHLVSGDAIRAIEYNERSIEAAERLGDRVSYAFGILNVGEILHTIGRWPEARAKLQQAEEVMRAEAVNWALPYAPSLVARVLANEGDFEGATAILIEQLPLVIQMDDRQLLELVHGGLAEVEIMSGRPEAAVARLEPMEAGLDELMIQTLLAWAYLESSQLERATTTITSAVEGARRQKQNLALVDALRVKGMVLARQGCLGEAERIFEEGLTLARSLPSPYAEARMLVQLGLLDRENGNERQAQQRLDGALAIFRRLGARKDVEQVEQLALS